jgi:hypothetical protein
MILYLRITISSAAEAEFRPNRPEIRGRVMAADRMSAAVEQNNNKIHVGDSSDDKSPRVSS